MTCCHKGLYAPDIFAYHRSLPPDKYLIERKSLIPDHTLIRKEMTTIAKAKIGLILLLFKIVCH